MTPYAEINAHHIGTSHVLNGSACEDFSTTYSDDTVSIIAISDGHGDRNCFRSEKGARYACDVTVSLCRKFQSITSHIEHIGSCDFEELVVSLEEEIAAQWKEKVWSDAKTYPFTVDELSKVSEQAQDSYREGKRTEKAYGCTLIAAMCTENYWLGMQIGDGKCLAAFDDGVFIEPIPNDENCFGNRSTSLCNSNVKESFRHYYSDIKPAAVFVSSDGVEESFDQQGLYNCFYSVAFWLKEEGKDVASEKLKDLLPQISEGGSGDDVSLSVMVSLTGELAKPRQTLEQVYGRVRVCADVLEQCNIKLADTKDKLAETIAQKNLLKKEIAELKETLEQKEKTIEKISDESRQLEDSISELKDKIQKATVQMEKAEKYRTSAEKYWSGEFEKLGIGYHSEAGESFSDGATEIMEVSDSQSVMEEKTEVPLADCQED